MQNEKPDYLARAYFHSFKLSPDTVLRSCDIVDDQGRYWITTDGRLFSYCRGRPLQRQFYEEPNGYLSCRIGNRKYYLHRLLAITYCGNRQQKKILNDCVVHHLDFNPRNNSLDNLAIMTKQKHDTIHTLWRKWSRCQNNL